MSLFDHYLLKDFSESTLGKMYIIDSGYTIKYVNFSYSEIVDNDINPQDYIGKNMIDLIEGDEVKRYYSDIYENIFNGNLPNYYTTDHCDGPSTKRHVMIVMTPLLNNGDIESIFHHSYIFEQINRPPLPFLASDGSNGPTNDIIVKTCSSCSKVRWNEEWIEPSDYYARGGSDHVNLSHGYCDDCYKSKKEELDKAIQRKPDN